ncbi:MAG: DUF218 domain-containing protein [Pseudanabaena sp. SU_2_4]|nr:DUF218 domain-containing protein [Pseudanabaena sp. SU_2_4]
MVIFMGCLTALGSLAILNIHPFLAKSSPINADILVVEGWLPDYAIQSAVTEFKQGSYHKLITIGGSLPRGFYLSEYKTFAELAAATLIALGVDREQLIVVSDPSQSQSRTYNSAVILNQWLSTSELQIKSLNIYTLGTHARRSWLLFKEVLEPQISVGIVANEPLNYDSKNWWHSSEGIRTVISELLAYLYVRIFKL